jgi:hypothetical protein
MDWNCPRKVANAAALFLHVTISGHAAADIVLAHDYDEQNGADTPGGVGGVMPILSKSFAIQYGSVSGLPSVELRACHLDETKARKERLIFDT